MGRPLSPSPPPTPPESDDGDDGGGELPMEMPLTEVPDVQEEDKEEGMEYAGILDPNRLILLVTGEGADPYNTMSLLLRYFNDVPPYMRSFIEWFGTPHGRLATDDAGITIEASPKPGRIYVEGVLTDNDFSVFLSVCANLAKKLLPVLSIAEFDQFAKAVAQHDNEYDINFQTFIKYLVSRYNNYVAREAHPQVPIRHSYLETDDSEMQRMYQMVPIKYIEAAVLNFDALQPTEAEYQFVGRLNESIIRPVYHEMVVMYRTYRDYYLDLIQKCIVMLVPDHIRLDDQFRNDIEVFSPSLLTKYPHFNVDRAEFLHLLYIGLIEKGTFPWATRDNDLALLRGLEGGIYDIYQLRTIAGGGFGMVLQLIATGLYYLYFLIIKMYPRYERLKPTLTPLFSDALMEMVVNFNPHLVRTHQVNTENLNAAIRFVQSLEAGYVNPYDATMGLPEVPNFDLDELDEAMRNFAKLPPVPNYVPEIVKPKGNGGEGGDGGGGDNEDDRGDHGPIAPAIIPSVEHFEHFNDAIIEGGDEEEQIVQDELEELIRENKNARKRRRSIVTNVNDLKEEEVGPHDDKRRADYQDPALSRYCTLSSSIA